MPVSKNNHLYYTKEQYAAAKANDNALEYARRQGYDLVKSGRYYHLRDHDSLVFTPDGKWFWNSRGVRGSALEFITLYEGRSFPEAVLILAGTATGAPTEAPAKAPAAAPPPKEKELTEFVLPLRAPKMQRLFGYLCGARKIDYTVVTKMVAQRVVYESIYRTRSGRELHNACFVSYNGLGAPCSAYQRGMGFPYKGEVSGSSKDWGWVFSGRKPTKLCVFEAAIDAASYVTLLLRQGQLPLENTDYLALGGLNFTPIQRYLDRHPHTDTVTLLLDSDPPGQTAAARFRAALEDLGYTVETILPPMGKDWNDTLKALCEEQK